MIHLGYETGTGRPVSIPLAHMAVTGQTQQSGKTTTLEALIDRGNLRAVVFVTKPGEKSFAEGRRILPFFKEHADWEYVKELLEARRSESLSKWDGYLMRVCSRARTLQDVRKNVEGELPKKKSVRPSHYEVLAGYLDLIIPELERVEYTDKLDLQRGVNIMDLAGMSDDMQSMVIRSTIEQIHKRERNTVLVLPEAWKFIPEGGRSSVFQALQALIREGATNGNFVWIDAQDLAVVSKRILKSVSVWILGKQQEANEVARTINHLIEPLQIRPDMIKSLGIGQFLICADSSPARRVYVQPKWLGELDALAIARGEESVETAQAIFRQKKRELTARPVFETRPVIRADEVTILHGGAKSGREIFTKGESNASGKNKGQEKGGAPAIESEDFGSGANVARKSIQRAAAGGDGVPGGNGMAGKSAEVDAQDGNSGRIGGEIANREENQTMWKERAETAEAQVVQLRADVQDLRRQLNEYREIAGFGPNGGEPVVVQKTAGEPGRYDFDLIYNEIVRRAQNDPGILQLLATRPELRVVIEPKVLDVDGTKLRGGIALLLHQGFFEHPQSGYAVFSELQRIGRKVAKRTVYDELDRIAEMGFLTKEETGYQATDLKVSVKR